jgi:apolipoprotein N-acyltransferase
VFSKKPYSIHKIQVLFSILFSGTCWYFSNGLGGDFWYLLWLAPIPVLLISFNTSGRMTFLISFLAYLIGRFSWFSYLVMVVTIVPAIIFTILLPLIFALIITITRKTVIKTRSWLAIFAFPVFFTAFEFLLLLFSPDGSAASIAYSQSNVLPLIQIASLTGILGITFIITFIPSAIAMSWYYRREKLKLQYIIGSAIVILIPAFLYGITRISNNADKSTIKVGLAVLDEKFHNMADHPDFKKEIPAAEYYAKEVADLAAQGTQLIVLPERAINMNKESSDDIINILGLAAKQNHVFIIIGYTNFRNEQERNSSLVINDQGNVVADYNKAHLVKGLENQFTPGNEIGLFQFKGVQAGTAICKDLDFPSYLQKYGMRNVAFLYIPAWDFIKDGWLHSRMAILRGVENGFSEIRCARQGRLTISDCYGRVTYEASSSNNNATSLVGKVSLQKRNTVYTRFGNWFGIINFIIAANIIFIVTRKKSAKFFSPS